MDAVVAHSHDMIRKGSKSFAAAAWLFDPATRARAYMLYSWCRYCDDEIDGQEFGFGAESLTSAERQARLDTLRERTHMALAGEPVSDPVFAAFQRVARESHIAERHALELLAGFEMDVQGVRYTELADTLVYCYRVAGVVGVMMAYVMGVRDRQVLARAADLGIAFQLTNIARDVLDDAAGGRCYLPAAWLAQAGLTTENLAQPAQRDALARVVARLLDEADRYYASAAQGLAALPLRSAWAVATALGVYREIGELVRARGALAWQQRAVVSRPSKAWHGVRALGAAVRARTMRRLKAQVPRDASLWMMPNLCAED